MNTQTQALHMALGQLHTNRVHDPRLLSAFDTVKREAYVPKAYRHAAYIDDHIAIGGNRLMLAPLASAQAIMLADIQPSDRVLVVGSGLGYEVALLAELVDHVWGIESNAVLLAESRIHLASQGVKNATLEKVAALSDGYGHSAPYDAIIINGGIKNLPPILSSQLSHGGRLVGIEQLAARPGNKAGLGKFFLVTREQAISGARYHGDVSAALLPSFEINSGFTL